MSAATRRRDSGWVRGLGTFREHFFIQNFECHFKSQKVWPRCSQDVSRSPKLLRGLPKYFQNRARESSAGVPKPLWHENDAMSPNFIIYQTWDTFTQLSESLVFKDFRIQTGSQKQRERKHNESSAQITKTCPGGAQGRLKVTPRLPQGSQKGVETR